MSPVPPPPAAGHRDPFELFMGSHERIRRALGTMRTLADAATPAAEVPGLARELLDCFDTVVLPHHREEEREFWPMLERARAAADEHAACVRAAERLRDEHTELEAMWRRLLPPLQALARGRAPPLPGAALAELAGRYAQHAQFEDEVLVPMARHLLSPTDQTRMAIAVLLSRLPAGKWGMV